MTPTGGNGGKGGNVYIRVNSHLDSLIIPKSVYKAENGSNGKGKCQPAVEEEIYILISLLEHSL